MVEYRSLRIINGKPKSVIVSEDGNVTNYNPSKSELKNLENENYKQKTRSNVYKDEQLLNFLKDFYQENGRIPTEADFVQDPKYPGGNIYHLRFGGWNKALMLAGIDVSKKVIRASKTYTDDELLNYLKFFYDKNKRAPVQTDFSNNHIYPRYCTYYRRFGSWSNALRLVGLDIETMIKNGIVQNSDQKARLSELYVKGYFQELSEDLSGDNKNSPVDGICPRGQTYDVKSSKFYENNHFSYMFKNKEKKKIEYYFLLGFNVDYTKLLRVWRVPGWLIETNIIVIRMYENGMSNEYMFNGHNMVEYEITDKFKEIVDIEKYLKI